MNELFHKEKQFVRQRRKRDYASVNDDMEFVYFFLDENTVDHDFIFPTNSLLTLNEECSAQVFPKDAHTY